MTLYANINQHSKYFHGQVAKEPFKIVLMPTSDLYCWSGNQNQYRTSDLDFFIRTESGECSGQVNPDTFLPLIEQNEPAALTRQNLFAQ